MCYTHTCCVHRYLYFAIAVNVLSFTPRALVFFLTQANSPSPSLLERWFFPYQGQFLPACNHILWKICDDERHQAIVAQKEATSMQIINTNPHNTLEMSYQYSDTSFFLKECFFNVVTASAHPSTPTTFPMAIFTTPQ